MLRLLNGAHCSIATSPDLESEHLDKIIPYLLLWIPRIISTSHLLNITFIISSQCSKITNSIKMCTNQILEDHNDWFTSVGYKTLSVGVSHQLSWLIEWVTCTSDLQSSESYIISMTYGTLQFLHYTCLLHCKPTLQIMARYRVWNLTFILTCWAPVFCRVLALGCITSYL